MQRQCTTHARARKVGLHRGALCTYVSEMPELKHEPGPRKPIASLSFNFDVDPMNINIWRYTFFRAMILDLRRDSVFGA